MNSQIQLKIAIGVICAIVFMAGVIWISYSAQKKTLEYPAIEPEEFINAVIVSIKLERSYARLEFDNGVKRTTSFARNSQYQPSDIEGFIRLGDQFLKNSKTDTVRIVREGKSYLFVLHKEINCCR